MKIIKKIIASLFLGQILFVPIASGYQLNTVDIYKQAVRQNHNFFRQLYHYKGAIDVSNIFGDTAYCLALQYHDRSTMQFLAYYGADRHHSCVQRRWAENQQKNKFLSSSSRRAQDYTQPSGTTVAATSSSRNYLWWGLGALAVGGGVAALASGGGGGSSGGSATQNNTVTDDNSGNHNESSEDNSGNTGGDDNNGGETTGGDDELTNVSAASFKTAEYSDSGFLEGVKASSLYSQIYQQDKNGKLVSHQAASSNPLKTITVGVIDTGVLAHHDLDGKIVGGYNANRYNTAGNIWGYAHGNLHYYVFSKNDKYYLVRIDVTSNTYKKFLDLSRDELDAKLSSTYHLNFDDFSVLNGGGGSTPGITDKNVDVTNVNDLWDMFSELSHGTHVAGIIAANKNNIGGHGIAFENALIYSGSWDYEQNLLPMVQDMISHGVTVINNSWGLDVGSRNAANASTLYSSDNISALKAYAYAAKNKAVWVQATGNNGATEAAIHAGMGGLDISEYGYQKHSEYEVPFIAVTALGANGSLASYANWCGSTKNYCIAAPGDGVISASAIQDAYMPMNGTSMAVPVVSGSIALLNGYYPWLSAQNIAWLLLETANRKEGVYDDSSIYGRGVLDLEAAITTPMGSLSVPSSSSLSSLTPVQNSHISGSAVMSNSLKQVIPTSITAFDALKRPFEYGTSGMVSTTHVSNANLRNEVARAGMFNKKKQVINNKNGFQFSTSEAMNKGGHANLATVDVVNESDNGATRFYYAENSKYSTSDSVLRPTENPYFAMNEAYGAESMLNLSDTSKLKLSLQTGENGLYGRDYEQDRQKFDERSYAVGAEYSFNLTDYLELATMGGMLYEEDAMLGLNGRGGLAIRDGSTYYMGLKAKLNLTQNISLLAAYYRGYTSGQETALMRISDLETESFMLAGEYQLNQKDKFGMSLSSPLSVRRGHTSFQYASGRDNYSDTAYMKTLKGSLKPAAKEYDLGVYYMGAPKENLSFMGKVEARFNADGEKGTTDYIGILGVSKSF